MKARDNMLVEWIESNGEVEYQPAVAAMARRVDDILAGKVGECCWLLQHPHLYTAGTSAKEKDLLVKDLHPIFRVGRGGQYTYHGPGQRVVYVMLDLKKRNPDVRFFVASLENWIMQTLGAFGIKSHRAKGRVGIWTVNKQTGAEEKIAAIGIKLRRWVSCHGIALNVNCDLTKYEAINPCGISEFGITSFERLGVGATMAEIDVELRNQFHKIFGKTIKSEKLILE